MYLCGFSAQPGGSGGYGYCTGTEFVTLAKPVPSWVTGFAGHAGSNHALGAASTSPRAGLYCHHHLWLASANSSLAMTTATRRRNATATTRYRNATAATRYRNATAATRYRNATAATRYRNATAATWYRNAMAATQYRNTTAATWYRNTTAATWYRNATAATRYRNTTTATWHRNATTATWCRGATTATRRRGVMKTATRDSDTAHGATTATATRRVALRQRQQHGTWRYDSDSDTAPRHDEDSDTAPRHGEDNDTAPQHGEDNDTAPRHGESASSSASGSVSIKKRHRTLSYGGSLRGAGRAKWETGRHSFTQLVGYDYVMISQELLDILNESWPLLFRPDIVALCVPKLEQLVFCGNRQGGSANFVWFRFNPSPNLNRTNVNLNQWFVTRKIREMSTVVTDAQQLDEMKQVLYGSAYFDSFVDLRYIVIGNSVEKSSKNPDLLVYSTKGSSGYKPTKRCDDPALGDLIQWLIWGRRMNLGQNCSDNESDGASGVNTQGSNST
ncbi:hypothetical protein EDB84DRAFT_1675312 [Lactarius hengduanensis]|nr:hypothetical protein EDB84DRAFT_1675312 [Lactarius hengduanensis]